MNNISQMLYDFAERDVHSNIPFGNMFKGMLDAEHAAEIISDVMTDRLMPLSNGIPSTGRVSIVDNDYWEAQSEEWKDENKDLCRNEHLYSITEIVSAKFEDNLNVRLTIRKLCIKFNLKDANNV